jgi:protein phosphatase
MTSEEHPAIEIPQGALVVLVGASGSGKSSFAARHFLPTEVVSSDRLRAMICDDEADQSVSPQAFELLYLIVRRRLEAGRTAVVDATSTTPEARTVLTAVARECGAPAFAIVLDLSPEICLRNDALRAGRSVGRSVVAAQTEALARSLPGVGAEGFEGVWVLRDEDEVRRARVRRTASVPQPPPL